MLTKTMQEQLNAPIPSGSVTQRSQAGQTLDYVEAWWVIDRLNSILGNGAWGSELVTHEHVCTTVKDPGKDEKHTVTYRATVRLHGEFVAMMGVGFASNTSKSLGDAHETAGKSAESDALKRAAMKLGRHLGLALYQKPDEAGERTHVSKAHPARLSECTSGDHLLSWLNHYAPGVPIIDRPKLEAGVRAAATRCGVGEAQAVAWMQAAHG